MQTGAFWPILSGCLADAAEPILTADDVVVEKTKQKESMVNNVSYDKHDANTERC